MANNLFDNPNPDYFGYSNQNENVYDFFNRSAHPKFLVVKNKLEELFSHYPDEHKYELKKRFKKSFHSCFYELFLYSLFKGLGFSIKIHPELGVSGKTPDFLVSNDKMEFVVEAQIVTGKSAEKVNQDRKRNEFYDHINKLGLKGFFIEINELEFKSSKQPSTRALKAFLKEEIGKLNHKEIRAKLNSGGLSNLDSLIYEDKDVRIVMNTIPVDQIDEKDKSKNIIGMWPMQFSSGHELESISKAIQKKSKKYKKIGYPLLVCVNSHIVFMTRKLDAQNVVWGTDGDDIEKFDGIFYAQNKFINTELSGIMITKVFPFNIPIADCWIFKHPQSRMEIDFKMLGLAFDEVKDYRINNNAGIVPNDIFKIAPNWVTGFE